MIWKRYAPRADRPRNDAWVATVTRSQIEVERVGTNLRRQVTGAGSLTSPYGAMPSRTPQTWLLRPDATPDQWRSIRAAALRFFQNFRNPGTQTGSTCAASSISPSSASSGSLCPRSSSGIPASASHSSAGTVTGLLARPARNPSGSDRSVQSSGTLSESGKVASSSRETYRSPQVVRLLTRNARHPPPLLP